MGHMVDQRQVVQRRLTAVAIVHAEDTEQPALSIEQGGAPGGGDSVCRGEGAEGLPERVGVDIERDDPLGAVGRGAAAACLGPGRHPIDGLLELWPEVAAVAAFAERL